jgi:hypothetical protein
MAPVGKVSNRHGRRRNYDSLPSLLESTGDSTHTAQAPVVFAFATAAWGGGMWQKSTDLNTTPNSTANGLHVLGNFVESQRLLDYGITFLTVL